MPQKLLKLLLVAVIWWALGGLENATARGKPAQVDLRPLYFELGLYTKSQGMRPSCAVFAILGALEFHYSQQTRAATPLSEEFLIWATRQVNPRQENFDGFTFAEVLAALERYGVARSEMMPNLLGEPLEQLSPDPQALQEALPRQNVLVQRAYGSNEAKIAAIRRELDEGYPVAVALAWPPRGVVARVHSLRDQQPQPGPGHAVTIVGYQSSPQQPDETIFLFRNSYGMHWGIGGYGYVSEVYLREHLWEVVSFRLPQ